MNFICTDDSNEQEWESFLLSLPHAPFLQSWHMRTLHNRISEETIAIVMRCVQDGSVRGCALGSVVRARRGHYLYFPYGPVCLPEDRAKIFPLFTEYARKKARELHLDFLRSSPFWEDTSSNRSLYQQHGWQRAPLHMLAEHTWVLDVQKSEEELLAAMRKTTRNLIRQAERKGVHITWSKNINDLHHFFAIQKETIARHKFVPYPDAFVRAQVEAFNTHNHARIVQAEWNGDVVAVAIIMFYGKTASYHHAASRTGLKIPASYLLQWRVIQEAKQRGCTAYNFWGIVPPDKLQSPLLRRPHPFAGVTTFKTGFGGARVDLLPCHDYPLTARYHATRIIETIRRYKRGFF